MHIQYTPAHTHRPVRTCMCVCIHAYVTPCACRTLGICSILPEVPASSSLQRPPPAAAVAAAGAAGGLHNCRGGLVITVGQGRETKCHRPADYGRRYMKTYVNLAMIPPRSGGHFGDAQCVGCRCADVRMCRCADVLHGTNRTPRFASRDSRCRCTLSPCIHPPPSSFSSSRSRD